MYAYTHVAVYGEDYITAAKSTMRLFKSNGFTAIINDNIIGLILGLGVLLGGLLTAMVAALLATLIISAWWIPLAVVGLLVGMIMTSLVMNAMTSAVATTFVCWAEDPAAMNQGRPSYFKRITDAANVRFPDWQQQ